MNHKQTQREYRQLKRKFLRLGYVCAGSLMLLYRKCGRETCACYKDKKAEHGPYYIWTRKVMGKTVTRTLSAQQAKLCREYLDNLKSVNPILEKMKALAAQMIEMTDTPG